MHYNSIRAMAPALVISIGIYPSQLADRLDLGLVAQVISSPLCVLAVILTVEMLARQADRRWTRLGVPLPVPGAPAFATAKVLRSRRDFGNYAASHV